MAAAGMLTVLILIVGCGGGGKQPPNIDLAATPWEVSAESPLGGAGVNLSADSLGVTPAGTAAAPESPAVLPPAPQETIQVPDPKDFTEGWRVQLSANSTLADADGRARGARIKFTEPVYVEYEPPFYKVRVGDFLTRPEAESMATRARAEGYEGAWVVETLVLRPKR
jgi:cell division septation protein DedD